MAPPPDLDRTRETNADVRPEALARHQNPDVALEPAFDEIVKLAALLCHTPAALIGFVGERDRIFTASPGLGEGDADLSRLVGEFTLPEADLLVIPDLSTDERTCDNPLVTGDPGIRFYAGAPLVGSDGVATGALCVIDTVARPAGLSPAQQDGLRTLAAQVVGQLDLRRLIKEREENVIVLERLTRKASIREKFWRGLFESMQDGFILGELIRDADGAVADWRYLDVNPAWSTLVGERRDQLIGVSIKTFFPSIEPEWIAFPATAIETCAPVSFSHEAAMLGRHYSGTVTPLDGDRFSILFRETTARVREERRQEAILQLGDRLRVCSSIEQVIDITTTITGTTMQLSRCMLNWLDQAHDIIEISKAWNAPGTQGGTGLHRYADYGDYAAQITSGTAAVVGDVRSDDRIGGRGAALLELGIAAFVIMPIRDGERTVGSILVHSAQPRDWTKSDMTFLGAVASRVELSAARLRAEQQQRLLNEEMSHRLKNTLSMVQAIATQTMRGASDKEAVSVFSRRLTALAGAHDVLLQQQWESAQLTQIARSVLSRTGQVDRVRIEGPALSLGPRATLSLSLVLHELATNAAKYGSLSVEEGSVAFRWRVSGEGADGELTIEWSETGGPPAVEPNQKGFGSRLIQMGLIGTGDVDVRYERSGLTVTMRAPLIEII